MNTGRTAEAPTILRIAADKQWKTQWSWRVIQSRWAAGYRIYIARATLEVSASRGSQRKPRKTFQRTLLYRWGQWATVIWIVTNKVTSFISKGWRDLEKFRLHYNKNDDYYYCGTIALEAQILLRAACLSLWIAPILQRHRLSFWWFEFWLSLDIA